MQAGEEKQPGGQAGRKWKDVTAAAGALELESKGGKRQLSGRKNAPTPIFHDILARLGRGENLIVAGRRILTLAREHVSPIS